MCPTRLASPRASTAGDGPATPAAGAVSSVQCSAASQPNAVTDAQFAELQQHWSDGEITEILGVVAMFAFLNRWNDTMGTPLEMPAAEVAKKALGDQGWNAGRHAP